VDEGMKQALLKTHKKWETTLQKLNEVNDYVNTSCSICKLQRERHTILSCKTCPVHQECQQPTGLRPGFFASLDSSILTCCYIVGYLEDKLKEV